MRFLVDANLSPVLAHALGFAGHDVAHVRDLGLQAAHDDELVHRAAEEGRVIVSADTDFGSILAQSGADRPSVVLLRLRTPRSASALGALLLSNLAAVADDLASGAVVVLEDERVRVRPLPLR